MKNDFIKFLGQSFQGFDLIDLANASRKKKDLDRNNRELLNKYILEYKTGQISREVCVHRLSVLTGMDKKEALKFCNSLMESNVTALGSKV